jgi:hypothetical protein
MGFGADMSAANKCSIEDMDVFNEKPIWICCDGSRVGVLANKYAYLPKLKKD